MQTVEMLAPHKQQFEFIKSPAKFRAFIGGVGSGKTIIGCAEMIRYALENPGSLNVIAAPTYPMLRDATQRTFFELCPEKIIREFNKGKNEVVLLNGSELLFRSCEYPERLRGPNLASFYGDEASLWGHTAWKILIGRLRQPGFEQRGWITSTPKGFNWIYTEFVEKQRASYDIVYCSSKDNPHLPPDFITSLEESYSGVFARQEILGEFVAPEGVVYPLFSRRAHVRECANRKFKSVMYGVDWGYTNPSVILTIGVDSDNRLYVIDEFYRKRVMIDDLVAIAKQQQEQWGAGPFYADPSEPQFIDAFNQDGLTCIPANNEIIPGINKVGALLEVRKDGKPRLFIDPKCVHTVMEFENYCYADAKEGKPVQDKPLKIHDHAMDALRYAAISMGRGGVSYLDNMAKLFNAGV